MGPGSRESVAANSYRLAGRTAAVVEVSLGRGCFERLVRHVVPQLLEAVVLAGFGCEDMKHDVDVVADDPGRLGRAFDRARHQAVVGLETLVHLVPDRL